MFKIALYSLETNKQKQQQKPHTIGFHVRWLCFSSIRTKPELGSPNPVKISVFLWNILTLLKLNINWNHTSFLQDTFISRIFWSFQTTLKKKKQKTKSLWDDESCCCNFKQQKEKSIHAEDFEVTKFCPSPSADLWLRSSFSVEKTGGRSRQDLVDVSLKGH